MAQLGRAFGSVGDFGGDSRDDLVVSATGRGAVPGTTAVGGALYYLPGRAYAGSGGLTSLPATALGGPAASVPAGQPFATGAQNFGAIVGRAGNAFDAGASGRLDVLVHRPTTDELYLYSGDTGLVQAQRVRVTGSGNPGMSIANAYSPSLPPHAAFDSPDLLGDLDGDGIADICVGGNTGGAVSLLYGYDLAQLAMPPAAPQSWAWETTIAAATTNIAPASANAATRREVTYHGDVDDDGHPDIVIGDRGATDAAGVVTLLH
jgi:hypothetical protein